MRSAADSATMRLRLSGRQRWSAVEEALNSTRAWFGGGPFGGGDLSRGGRSGSILRTNFRSSKRSRRSSGDKRSAGRRLAWERPPFSSDSWGAPKSFCLAAWSGLIGWKVSCRFRSWAMLAETSSISRASSSGSAGGLDFRCSGLIGSLPALAIRNTEAWTIRQLFFEGLRTKRSCVWLSFSSTLEFWAFVNDVRPCSMWPEVPGWSRDCRGDSAEVLEERVTERNASCGRNGSFSRTLSLNTCVCLPLDKPKSGADAEKFMPLSAAKMPVSPSWCSEHAWHKTYHMP
mmetsp:Transcript_45148/g.130721  ORF Transcript_45148/g.130721 Transcript_45148/m.130721 type:complete len:288 (+) Transcript_45148:1260-2123(+)